MGQRSCKNCGKTIPDSRRSDALYCCDECGWDYRNRQKRYDQKEKRDIDRKLLRNYRIVSEFYRKGLVNVSIETLESHGFDADFYTHTEDTDYGSKTSVVRIYEYRLTFIDDKCKIEKLLL